MVRNASVHSVHHLLSVLKKRSAAPLAVYVLDTKCSSSKKNSALSRYFCHIVAELENKI
jgi:hypothetical protein